MWAAWILVFLGVVDVAAFFFFCCGCICLKVATDTNRSTWKEGKRKDNIQRNMDGQMSGRESQRSDDERTQRWSFRRNLVLVKKSFSRLSAAQSGNVIYQLSTDSYFIQEFSCVFFGLWSVLPFLLKSIRNSVEQSQKTESSHTLSCVFSPKHIGIYDPAFRKNSVNRHHCSL